jgi:hypothetical protein
MKNLMYIIAGMVGLAYMALILLSCRESLDACGDISKVEQPFYKMAAFIYRKASRKNNRLFNRTEVVKDLERMHPGSAGGQLSEAYYIKKTALSLMICLAGTVICSIISFNTYNKRLLKQDGSVSRNAFGEQAISIRIKTDVDNENIFAIDVEPMTPSEEELNVKYEEYISALEEEMLNGNSSLDNVTGSLNLTDTVEGYPFYAEWSSSRPDIVSSMGTVYEVEDVQEVVLTATVTYEDREWINDFVIKVMPETVSAEEANRIEMKEFLMDSELKSRNSDTWVLPTEYHGENVVWTEAVTDNSSLIWLLAILIAAAVFVMSDKDLHTDVEKRVKAIRRDYPDIVQKFVLYMGAGMTIRGAYGRIAQDYENGETDRSIEHPAYEEMLYTCRELQAGVSEGTAYEHFGRRTGAQEYVRLCTLLQQNLKKGNAAILDRLREEADKASQERLQNSRRLGEEAATKLLVPMVLMLLVVMIIIIIPAFSSTSI